MSVLSRIVQLSVGQPGEIGELVDELEVSFRVTHRLGREPSTAEITVQNPGVNLVREAQRAGALMVLRAGAQGRDRDIFKGRILKNGVKVARVDSGYTLTLKGTDGGVQLAQGFTSRSYGQEVTATELMHALAEDLGVDVASIQVGDEIRMPTMVLTGPAVDHLDRLCHLTGSVWTIRDEQLRVWPADKHTEEIVAVFSVADKTLIGSPSQKDSGEVVARADLDAGLRPGRRFVIPDAEFVQGTFVASTVVFLGSRTGSDFFVEAAGTPSGGRLPIAGAVSRGGSPPTPAQLSRAIAREELATRAGIQVGTIEAFDAQTGRASVRPGIRGRRIVDGVAESYDLPIIPDVPVFWIGFSGHVLSGQPKKGDEVLLLVVDQDISEWKREGGTVDAMDTRRGSLTDAVALPVRGLSAKSIPDATEQASDAFTVAGNSRLGGGDANDRVSTENRIIQALDAVVQRIDAVASFLNELELPVAGGGGGVAGPPLPPLVLAPIQWPDLGTDAVKAV